MMVSRLRKAEDESSLELQRLLHLIQLDKFIHCVRAVDAAWAEDDFRSINGQIEYLLTECVRERRKKSLDKNENGAPQS